MHRLFQRLALLLILAAFGCGPEEVPETARYLVYDWDPDTRSYRLFEREIRTLHDARSVDGEIASLRGGGRIVAATEEPTSEEEFRDALRIEGDVTPATDYEIHDGVVIGWDFDSLMMFTVYHHLERAAEYFEEIGVGPEVVGHVPVYYHPRLSGVVPIKLLTDNAAYAYTLDAFLIPPQFLIDGVPLFANRGVMIHEYSHAVFNRIVDADARAPRYLIESWSDASINRMAALNEGVADLFAALALGEPDFIEPSISRELFGLDRDLSVERTYTAALRETVEGSEPSTFDPYEVGSVIASTIWALRPAIDNDEALGRAVVAALQDFSEVDDGFTLADFFGPLLRRLPPHATAAACTTFQERLPALQEELRCDAP